MNDTDKEAFEKWMKDEDRHDGVFGNNNNFTRDEWIADKAWRAACTYKQEEIDELLGVEDVLRDHMNTIGYNQLKELEAENAKLKRFISALGYDQVVDTVIDSLEKLEYK